MMKKVFLLCLVAILTSCSTMLTPYSQNFSMYDFTPYTKEGFIITPAETGFAYQPVGELSVEFVPGYKKDIIKREKPFISQNPETDEMYSVKQPTGDKKANGSTLHLNTCWMNSSNTPKLQMLMEYSDSKHKQITHIHTANTAQQYI